MTPVKFEGEPPFALPTVQRGRASAVDDTVEMTLFVLAPGQGDKPVPVRAQMIVDVAESLSRQLTVALNQARARARQA
jgi:hypothetical protein